MKAQLIVGETLVSETVEVVAPPVAGDLVIWGDRRHRVKEIGHNLDKKKMQIICHEKPPKLVPETVIEPETFQEAEEKSRGGRSEPISLDLLDDKDVHGEAE